MKDTQMLKNIVVAIKYICHSNSYLIDIYRENNDIKIDIVDKKEGKLIYAHDFPNTRYLYYSLVEELINIFGNEEVMISRVFQEKDQIYQQGIYVNNLEFRFDVNSKNSLEVNSVLERHGKINCKAQQNRTKTKQKTNRIAR